MKKSQLLLATLALSLMAFQSHAVQDPLTGIVTVYDAADVISPEMPAISGNVRTPPFSPIEALSISVDGFVLSAFNILISNTLLLEEGTHPFIFEGNVHTIVVGPGQLGAFLTAFADDGISKVPMLWDVLPGTNGGIRYVSVDVDGDGVPGGKILEGPFIDQQINFDFEVPAALPSVTVSIITPADSDSEQECTEHFGTSLVLEAEIVGLYNLAVFDNVYWTVNGAPVGDGLSVSPFLELGGPYDIIAEARVSNGINTDTDSRTVSIEDTTPPKIVISFTHTPSGQIITSVPANVVADVTVNVDVIDACDPEAFLESATVLPIVVYPIVDGDRMIIDTKGRETQIKFSSDQSSLAIMANARDNNGNLNGGLNFVNGTLPIGE